MKIMSIESFNYKNPIQFENFINSLQRINIHNEALLSTNYKTDSITELNKIKSNYNKLITNNISTNLKQNFLCYSSSISENDSIFIALVIKPPICFPCFEKMYKNYLTLNCTHYIITDKNGSAQLNNWLRYHEKDIKSLTINTFDQTLGSYNIYFSNNTNQIIIPINSTNNLEIINYIQDQIK